MSAHTEGFLESDSTKGTVNTEFPTPGEIMRSIMRKLPIEAVTYTSSEDLVVDSNKNLTAMHIEPTVPNAKQFGFWLESYNNWVRHNTGESFDTHTSSSPALKMLRKSSLRSQRENSNKAAIDLLQSWIEEEPDERWASDLARLKKTIDDQRIEGRKLFK